MLSSRKSTMLFAAAFALFGAVASAQAQAAPDTAGHRVSVGGAFLVVRQPDTRGEGGTYSLPPHGDARGMSIFAGVALTRVIALEGELSIPARIWNTQQWSHPSNRGTTTTEHRDVIVTALLRGHIARYFDVVGGGGLVFARTSATLVYTDYYGGTSTTSTFTKRAPGGAQPAATVGFDGPIPLGRHVAVVPTVRFYWLSRPVLDFGPPYDPPVAVPGSRACRGGIGMRVTF